MYAKIAPAFTPVFSGVRVTRCTFCRSLFVLLYFFLWPLYCLSFFDIRLLTPLVSSNSSSYNINYLHNWKILVIFLSLFLWHAFFMTVVDRGFAPRTGQTKDYKIGICCFSSKHAALRRRGKEWLARNQDIMSEWSDISIRLVSLRLVL